LLWGARFLAGRKRDVLGEKGRRGVEQQDKRKNFRKPGRNGWKLQ